MAVFAIRLGFHLNNPGETLARAPSGITAGIVVAFLVVVLVEMIGLHIFHQPEGMDPINPESVRQYMAEIPTGSFVTVLVAWALGAFAGPWITRRITGSSPRWPAWVVAGLFAAMCAYNLVVVPGPTWMIAGALVGVGAASLLGLRIRVPQRS